MKKLRLATKLTNKVHAQRIKHIAGVNMNISSEKWWKKHVGKDLRIEEGKLLWIKKEFLYQQGCKSKVYWFIASQKIVKSWIERWKLNYEI